MADALGGLLGAIANPQQPPSILGKFAQFQEIQNLGAQGRNLGIQEERQQIALGQEQRTAQANELAGELMAQSLGGQIADITKLDRKVGLALKKELEFQTEGELKKLFGDAQIISSMLNEGLDQQAIVMLTKTKEMKQASGLNTKQEDAWIETIQTDRDRAQDNLNRLTGAGIRSGVLESPKSAAVQRKKMEDQQKQVNVLRKDFDRFSKEFRTVEDSFARIQAVAEKPSAAGDLALIFNFMKMLDPGSTVRESEFATAENAAGVPDRVRNQWNKIFNGEKLGPDQRADFLGQTQALFTSQQRTNDTRIQEVLDRGIQDQIQGKRIIGETALNQFNERIEKQGLTGGDVSGLSDEDLFNF